MDELNWMGFSKKGDLNDINFSSYGQRMMTMRERGKLKKWLLIFGIDCYQQ